MKKLKLTKGQCFELFVTTNAKPVDVKDMGIGELELLIDVRKILKKAGGGFLAKVISYEDQEVEPLQTLKGLQGSTEKGDIESAREFERTVNKLRADKFTFYSKHKGEEVELELENGALDAIKKVFELLGKKVYSQQSWGSIESYVAMSKALNSAQ